MEIYIKNNTYVTKRLNLKLDFDTRFVYKE